MGAALSQLQPYASALHFFGAELRHRRIAAGLSQGQLAKEVITHETMVNKVELALRVASVDLATRCDAVLVADGALVRLHQLVLAECARTADSADPPVVLSVHEARALRRLLAVGLDGSWADAGHAEGLGRRHGSGRDRIAPSRLHG